MRLHDLHPPEGSKKGLKRVGRGQGSGHGKTACRGHKGLFARAGSKHKKGFEGGQSPLARRVPKFGFKNPFRKEYEAVNVASLVAKFASGATVDPDAMRETRLLRRNLPVKVLGKGEIGIALIVRANAFSQSAKQKIEAAGGKAEVV